MVNELNEINSVDRDAPLRLEEAARLVFRGKLGASGLRREIARGNLQVERIAGRVWVTLRAIEEMRERCRVPVAPPAPGADRPEKISDRRGKSLVEEGQSAQAALSLKLQRRKKQSRS